MSALIYIYIYTHTHGWSQATDSSEVRVICDLDYSLPTNSLNTYKEKS